MQINVRIEDGLYKKLQERAKTHRRTIGAELNTLLEEVLSTNTSEKSTNTSEESTNKPIRRKSIIGNDSETKNIWEGEDPRWYQ